MSGGGLGLVRDGRVGTIDVDVDIDVFSIVITAIGVASGWFGAGGGRWGCGRRRVTRTPTKTAKAESTRFLIGFWGLCRNGCGVLSVLGNVGGADVDCGGCGVVGFIRIGRGCPGNSIAWWIGLGIEISIALVAVDGWGVGGE